MLDQLIIAAIAVYIVVCLRAGGMITSCIWWANAPERVAALVELLLLMLMLALR